MILYHCAELPLQNLAKLGVILCSFSLWSLLSCYVQNDLNLLGLYYLLQDETPPFSH